MTPHCFQDGVYSFPRSNATFKAIRRTHFPEWGKACDDQLSGVLADIELMCLIFFFFLAERRHVKITWNTGGGVSLQSFPLEEAHVSCFILKNHQLYKNQLIWGIKWPNSDSLSLSKFIQSYRRSWQGGITSPPGAKKCHYIESEIYPIRILLKYIKIFLVNHQNIILL